MTDGARRAGEALAAAAPDLARVWRAGRAAARPQLFPGLLDGVIESFLAAVGEALAAGRDPALVWPETAGVVRLPCDPARANAELDAEWDLAEEVLAAALRSLGAAPDADEWVKRAIVFARAGARTLRSRGGPHGPPGVLAVRRHCDARAMRRSRGAGPR